MNYNVHFCSVNSNNMEAKQRSNSKAKAFLALIGLTATSLFLTSVIFHIDPFNVVDSIVDFASHHYFLTGFISLTVMVICFKGYQSLDKAIENNYQQKRMGGSTRSNKKKMVIQALLERAYYKTQKLKSHPIDKDAIKSLKFTEEDVLNSEEETNKRKINLQKAMLMGNSIKHKVKIFFKDQQSCKYVETTVWHADARHISLKGGITIPVHSIYKVEL